MPTGRFTGGRPKMAQARVRLLGIASGATLADEGQVMIMGEALKSADPLLARRLGLATVYQDDSLVRS